MFDNTISCSTAKLTARSYSYTSILCSSDANVKAIVGKNLPAAKFVGTFLERIETTHCIVSLLSFSIASMQETIVTGQIINPEAAERRSDLRHDHAEYLTHVYVVYCGRSDICPDRRRLSHVCLSRL